MLDLDQNTDKLLKDFSASGIGISVEGNNLKIESVRPLTNNQRNLILKLKSDLLNYLHDKTKIEENSNRVEVVTEKVIEQTAFLSISRRLVKPFQLPLDLATSFFCLGEKLAFDSACKVSNF